MKKGIIKILIKRFKSKTPKVYKAVSILAAALFAIFFGDGYIYELCDLGEFLCNNKEVIQWTLLALSGGALFTEEKEKDKK